MGRDNISFVAGAWAIIEMKSVDGSRAADIARRHERALQIVDAVLGVLLRRVRTLSELAPGPLARELRAFLTLEQALLPAPAEPATGERPLVFELDFGGEDGDFALPLDDAEAGS